MVRFDPSLEPLNERDSMPIMTSPSKKSFIPESSACRLEKSWDLVRDQRREIGIDFMLRVFEERPDLMEFFPFAASAHDDDSSEKAFCAALNAHANRIMNTIGNCVAGLNNMEELVPSLRSLGATHRRMGVKGDNYDVFFRHMMGVIGDALGPEHWTEEVEGAWKAAAESIKTVLLIPDAASESQSLQGWGIVMAGMCAYEAIMEPLRLAGFVGQQTYLPLWIIDRIATFCFALDLYAWYSPVCSRGIRKNKNILRHLKMDEWMTWPIIDTIVLVSVPLEHARWLFLCLFRSQCPARLESVGVPWTHAFGLIRIAALSRVLSSVRRAENTLLIRRRIGCEMRSMLKMAKVLLVLAYVTHLSACLWCIVVRIQIGFDPNAELASSSFFPSPEVLLGTTAAEIINGYTRAIYWAWVNLAGIGNHGSEPETTFECIFVLLVHFMGATLYAVVVGNVVSMLDTASSEENEVISDLAGLSDFMSECQVPQQSQNRIMQGYVMRNMIAKSTQDAKKDEFTPPDFPEDVAQRLPAHLQKDLILYGRVEALRRRDATFRHCSSDFLMALVGSLKSTVTLLPGDYLVEEGDESPSQLYLIEQGTMAVTMDGRSVKTLQRGCILGKPWLLQASTETFQNHSREEQKVPERRPGRTARRSFGDCNADNMEFRLNRKSMAVKPNRQSLLEWAFLGSDIADASVRAMEQCTIATGLSMEFELQHLRRRYPNDFKRLEAEMKRSQEARRNAAIIKGVSRAAAVLKRAVVHQKRMNDE